MSILRRIFTLLLFIPILIFFIIGLIICVIIDTFIIIPLYFILVGEFLLDFLFLTNEYIEFCSIHLEFKIK